MGDTNSERGEKKELLEIPPEGFESCFQCCNLEQASFYFGFPSESLVGAGYISSSGSNSSRRTAVPSPSDPAACPGASALPLDVPAHTALCYGGTDVKLISPTGGKAFNTLRKYLLSEMYQGLPHLPANLKLIFKGSLSVNEPMTAIKLASLFYDLELKRVPNALRSRRQVFAKHSLCARLCLGMYVVELDWHPDAPGEEVVLTCDTPEEDDITWTSDQSSEIVGSGKTLTIQVKEFGDAGRYTCLKGGQVLSHSLLLLHKKEDGLWSTDILRDQKEPKNKTFLKCEAKNYSGHFTCWWLTAISTDLKFTVKSSRGSSDPQGVTCGAATLSAEKVRVENREYKKYSVECQEDSACPAAEESLPIEVVLDAIHRLKYENYTSSFFIRDIIKPDPPKNLKLKPFKNSRDVEVSWEYPDTWSTPHSYFSLTFRVQVQGKRKEKKDSLFVDKTSASVTCHKEAKIHVQARDRYYSSSWSTWATVSCS
ncbi:interleukin-12 subunit beta [Tupaia chinensis]|uniref:interleukin-12 subunit beta n=1 Tax=Tupaia chinensis TaxID=246437 RepID=UPI000FFC4DBD|nr:interleukin-12 subunit beta [Tupaia chinensis]